MTTRLRLLGLGLLAGCGAQQLIDLVNDINNGSTTEKELVVKCAREDFGALRPFVLSLVDAALGDEAGPVSVTVGLPSGASMAIEFTGMNGTGLAVDVPLLVGYTCAITVSNVTGPPQVGEVTVTLESGGMLRVTGIVRFPEECTLFVLDDLDLRVDPAVLPVFRPTGTADVEAIAGALLVVLTGDVTFDGGGRALVDGIVTGPTGPSDIDLSIVLN
jgi:hypothetical protein